MSNCCKRRSAKFHVDSAVRFWAIANIREGGGGIKRPTPGQARVKLCDLQLWSLFLKLFAMWEDWGSQQYGKEPM